MPPTDPQVTAWESGGQQYEVVTYRRTGESDQEFLTRHEEAVAFWQGIYPPDE